MNINSEETNQKAIERVLSLLDDYESNLKEIDKLVAQIETYEATAPELEEFNRKIKEAKKHCNNTVFSLEFEN